MDKFEIRNSMFQQARLKLTLWYLLIIMTVSLAFSAFIYKGVTWEFQRRLQVIERRLELREHGIHPPRGQTQFFIQDFAEAKHRVWLILLYTNGAILAFSAAAGYFLAGKTLKPIEQVLEEQRRFVADASHELKTPLTALQTSIEVALRDKQLTLANAKAVLQASLEDIDGLKRLSNDLLSLARYQQNNHAFIKEAVNIKQIVERVCRKIVPLATKKRIKVIRRLRPIKFQANRESLEKLITLLLDNAVKYTPSKGQVSLTAKKHKRFLIFKIADSGPGIANKDLVHIFDRFYQADPSRAKTKVSGFGLGLSIAKRIVDLHHGSIKVQSTPGKGSAFMVKLPLS